ncbi:MAG: DUF2752 domain-containing protein [Candidatus Sabulitectum sp.]|nr:DUF2752 domain-containing protein [Candidatus Sabulitectum sp.]
MGAYRIFNLVVLGLLLYVLVFPLISPVMEKLFPSVMRCYYEDFTGDACPFCGLTRDMNCVLSGDRKQDRINTSFQLFLAVYTFEWLIRITMMLMSGRFTGRALPVIDVAIHCILAVCVLHAVNTI